MMAFDYEIFSTSNWQREVYPTHKDSVRAVHVGAYHWDYAFEQHPKSFVYVNEMNGEGWISDDHLHEFKTVQYEDGDEPFSKPIQLCIEQCVQSGDKGTIKLALSCLLARFRRYGDALRDTIYEWYAWPDLATREVEFLMIAVVIHNTKVLDKALDDAGEMLLYLMPQYGAEDFVGYIDRALKEVIKYREKYIEPRYLHHIDEAQLDLGDIIQTCREAAGEPCNFVPFDFMF